jgi:hypothetical protein
MAIIADTLFNESILAIDTLECVGAPFSEIFYGYSIFGLYDCGGDVPLHI